MNDRIQRFEKALRRSAEHWDFRQGWQRRGAVRRVSDGVAWLTGLDDVGYEELVHFDCGACGMVLDLSPEATGVVLLSGGDAVREGEGAEGQARLPELPVGPSCLGRILDPLGNPLDEGPSLNGAPRLPLFRPALEIVQRQAVSRSLWTGIMAIDAAIPIGRGQRELIIGDRNVGKTAIGLDIIAAQRGGDVLCVYVAIGLPVSRVLNVYQRLKDLDCLHHTVLIAADASDSPGMQYLAPHAGASVAEWFRDQGRDALVVFDDLTKHADAYRELALLLDRPPGREAYPGDIFHVQAELLERASPRCDPLGGGSVTALPIVETTDGDISAYIPTNLISITDGQIYLDTMRFERNERPAIDVGRSVSRIGSQAQSAWMRQVARHLRIELSRFEALESLTRVGLDMDAGLRQTVVRGRRLRQALRQDRFAARDLPEQVLSLWILRYGLPDQVPLGETSEWLRGWVRLVRRRRPRLVEAITADETPGAGWEEELRELARQHARNGAPGGAEPPAVGALP